MANNCFRIKCFVDSDQGDRKYMEDFVCISEESACVAGVNNRLYTDAGVNYFAVFDGHGGPEAASFAQKHLLQEIINHSAFQTNEDATVAKVLENSFVETTKQMWNVLDSWPRTPAGRPSTAGTTASVVIIRDNKLYIANVGDSTVVLGEQSDDGRYLARVLTKDHKPTLVEERKRIESGGGLVMQKAGVHRVVWHRPSIRKGPLLRSTTFESIPFLAVSRALGDLWSYNAETDVYIVSPTPDINTLEYDRSRHGFLIIASDGLWNAIDPTTAVTVVSRLLIRKRQGPFSSLSPASTLLRLALNRWSQNRMAADNISIIVLLFGDNADLYDPQPQLDNNNSLSSELISSTTFSKLQHEQTATSPGAEDDIATIQVTPKEFDSVPRKRPGFGRWQKKQRCPSFQIPITPEQRQAYWNLRGQKSFGTRLKRLDSSDVKACSEPRYFMGSRVKSDEKRSVLEKWSDGREPSQENCSTEQDVLQPSLSVKSSVLNRRAVLESRFLRKRLFKEIMNVH